MKKISVFLTGEIIVAIIIAGCVSTKTKDVFIKEKITGRKIIAMSGTRAPWVYEIVFIGFAYGNQICYRNFQFD